MSRGEIPFRDRPKLSNERTSKEKMVNGFILMMAKGASDGRDREQRVEFGFSRKKIMDKLPKHKLVSIVEFSIPWSLEKK